VTLPVGWRLLGAIEGVTGILTFGWSTGVIFAVASRLMAIRVGQNKLKSDQKAGLGENKK